MIAKDPEILLEDNVEIKKTVWFGVRTTTIPIRRVPQKWKEIPTNQYQQQATYQMNYLAQRVESRYEPTAQPIHLAQSHCSQNQKNHQADHKKSYLNINY